MQASPQSNVPDVTKRIEQWRRRLLDLSFRNTLINFRASRTSTIHLVEPGFQSIFDQLVNEENLLTFTLPPDPDEEIELGLSGLPDEEVDGDSVREETSSNASLRLPPLCPGEVRPDGDARKHKSVLYNLKLKARTSIEEQGVNTLFVSFGMLEWREPRSNSQDTYRSPLILVPVRLQRDTALDPFQISLMDDEEIVLNPTLAELLKKDFGIEMPALERNGGELNPRAVFNSVAVTVRAKRDWKVVEDVYLACFSFSKLAMYQDLQSNAELLVGHPLIRAVVGDLSALPQVPSDLPSANDLDEKVPPASSFHILNADSSQLEALAAATREVNLIIQGPPGTGKSQTIANLIAESLAQGKRVLFVSEKMAALEVVFRRLAGCGLDSLCLELHNHKAKKKAVVEQLAEALDDGVPGRVDPNALLALEQLYQRRKVLNGYVRALHDTKNKLGTSVFRVHGEVARRGDIPDLPFALSQVDSIDPQHLAAWIDLIGRLRTVGHVLLNQDTHLWQGCRLTEYSLRVQSEIQSRLGKLSDELHICMAEGAALASEIGMDEPVTRKDLRRLCQALDLVARNPIPHPDWLTSPSLSPLLASARTHALEAKDYHQRKGEILVDYKDEILAGNTGELCERLADRGAAAFVPFHLHTEQARELASAERNSLEGLITQAIRIQDAIIDTAASISGQAGLPTAATVESASFISRVVGILIRDPRPPREWLNRTQLVTARSKAIAAREHSQFSRVEGGKIREAYDEGLLNDAPGMAERFTGNYSSALRVFRPWYWKDMGSLKAFSKSHEKPTLDKARSVVMLASQVNAHEVWLAEHEGELTQCFGKHRAYTGKDTEWDALISSTESTMELLDAFGEQLPAGFQRVLLGGGSELVGLRSLHGTLNTLLEGLRVTLHDLSLYAKTEQLVAEGAHLTVGRNALASWLESLRDFWAAEASMRSLLRRNDDRPVSQLISAAGEAVAIKQMAERLSSEQDRLQSEFGHFFAGFDTKWDMVLAALVWTEEAKRLFEPGSAPVGFVRRVSGLDVMDPPSDSRREQFRAWLGMIDLRIRYTESIFDIHTAALGGELSAEVPVARTLEWLTLRLGNPTGLQEWLDFKHLRDECEREGLGDYLVQLVHFRPEPPLWTEVFLKRLYQLWLDDRYAKTPVLSSFRGPNHEAIAESFRRLDKDALRLAPKRIKEAVLSRRPSIEVGGIKSSEPAILYHEIQKRKRHKPIRRLFREIPNLLLTLKPCLLMSPLSVSSYLDAERIQFDLVIFDEASQVLPEDAVGAIVRGRQLVVAGDQKQLPPTDFFRAHFDEPDDEDAPEDGEILDSILDQCAALGLPSVMLRWHYRSRDEQLIAFSNRHFYGDRLVTFPNSHEKAPCRGVEFVHVPHGIYDRAGSHTNRIEARKVVDLVMEHAERSPEVSLGVVAFSKAQWRAIHDELEMRRRLRQELEEFFNEDKDEPFFIKNLEEIQGDERDVIIFSMGYGKDRTGRMVSSFGPVNRVGGERRLNVAVTRARNHVKFVASVRPEEIDLSGSTSDGARLLVRYMEYAIKGIGALEGAITGSGGEPDSPFEEAVIGELRARGLTVRSQIGCSGYRIDIGIVDEANPSRFLLGIECDGATYHSSGTARDRDRLRQEVLEGLGWRIHRIWSQDWVKDREGELRRVLEAIEQARKAALISVKESLEPVDTPEHTISEPKKTSRTPPKTPSISRPKKAVEKTVEYVEACLKLRSSTEEFYNDWSVESVTIPRLVTSCVQVESPVHIDRVTSVVAQVWGFRRVGNRISESISRGIEGAVRGQGIVRHGDFLWTQSMSFDQVPVRRPGKDQKLRPIQEVALEELGRAALFVVEESFSLPQEDLVTETSRILGYERTGAHISCRIQEAISALIDQQRLVETGGMVSMSGASPAAESSGALACLSKVWPGGVS